MYKPRGFYGKREKHTRPYKPIRASTKVSKKMFEKWMVVFAAKRHCLPIWVVTGVVIRFLHDGVLQKKDKSWCLEKVNYDCDQSPLLHTIVVCKSGLWLGVTARQTRGMTWINPVFTPCPKNQSNRRSILKDGAPAIALERTDTTLDISSKEPRSDKGG